MKRRVCLRYDSPHKKSIMMTQIGELGAELCVLCEETPTDSQYHRLYIETTLDDNTLHTLFDYCYDGGQILQWREVGK